MIGRIEPDWPAPRRVRAFTTTRQGGHSAGPWASLNLGARCGDEPAAVARNRAALRALLPGEPGWLTQVHGARVLPREELGDGAGDPPEADAAWAATAGLPCTVLSADCLPVLFCDAAGTRVAAAHAGWRGLAAGVLPATVAALGVAPGELLAWLGPAIGPAAYAVDAAFRERFLALDPGFAAAFGLREGRWHADLYAIARRQLAVLGVAGVFGGDYCTHADAQRWFSFRRDGDTGRMASVIWLA